MEKHPGGRPNKFTPEIKAKLLKALRKGAPYEHACNYARISFELFRTWRKKARNNESPYYEFFEDIKAAESETSLMWLEKIDKAMADGSWQAAAWKLERRYPAIYSINAPALKEAKRILKAIKESNESNNNDIPLTSA